MQPSNTEHSTHPITICLESGNDIFYGAFDKDSTDKTKALAVRFLRQSFIKSAEHEASNPHLVSRTKGCKG